MSSWIMGSWDFPEYTTGRTKVMKKEISFVRLKEQRGKQLSNEPINNGLIVQKIPNHEKQFAKEEQILAIQKVPKRDLIVFLLAPNQGEIIRLFVSLFLTYLVSLMLHFPFYSNVSILFYGFMALSVYAYSWMYAGVFHYVARKDRIKRELDEGKAVIVDFKIFGFVISIYCIVLGYSLVDY